MNKLEFKNMRAKVKEVTFIASMSLLGLIQFSNANANANAIELKENITSSDVDYGEMYVVEKSNTQNKNWQTDLIYSYGFSNPYLAIHGAQLNVSKKFGDFISFGISPVFYKTVDKNIAAEIDQKLQMQGVYTDVFQPRYSGHIFVGLTPLSGMLNWFSTKAMAFDLVFGVGAGAIKYRQENSLLPSIRLSLMPELMITSSFGINAGLQTSFERFSSREWVNRFDAMIGVTGRL